ncbi:MAG: MraY family glycosyltransferase [Pirellulaceae bacterium]
MIARKVGLVDKPDTTRKLHTSAIPLVGGIVVFCAVLITSLVVFLSFDISSRPTNRGELLGLLFGCAIVLIVGVLDDRFNLRGRQKLMGQILAVTVLIAFGFRFDSIQIMGVTFEFGIFSYLVVYAWCLASINSVNLLDGADGFAATIGFILCMALSVMSFYVGMTIDGLLCMAMAGALLGFLRYNFPPAKAYLGDAGSMLLGLFLGAVAIRSGFKQNMAYSVFAPIALLAIPFIDTSAAIIRRRFTGRSIYTEDRGHLHHILAKKGLSPVGSLMWVAALCTMTAAGGTISLIMRQAEFALASIALVIFVMVSGGLFGVAEAKLLQRRFSGFLRTFTSLKRNTTTIGVHESAIHLQGNRNWADIWNQLSSFANP